MGFKRLLNRYVRKTETPLFAVAMVGIIFLSILILNDLRSERKAFDAFVARIKATGTTHVAQVLMTKAPLEAERFVHRIFGYEYVTKVRIRNRYNQLIASKVTEIRNSVHHRIMNVFFGRQGDFFIPVKDAGSENVIGNWELGINTVEFSRKFFHRSGLLFLGGFIGFLFIAAIFSLFLNLVHTQPIHRLIDAIASIDPTRPTDGLIKPGDESPEIKKLIRSINLLLVEIEERFDDKRTAEGPLNLLRNHLEQLVAERTSELSSALEKIREAKETAEAANRAKSTFLANMSHEIRTPMSGILGMTDILIETELTSMQRGYVKTISRSAALLLSIINEVLDLSKIEAGKFRLVEEPFNLRKLIEETSGFFSSQAEKKGIDLVVRYDPGAPNSFIGDPVRIRQILINLMGNAVKFTRKGYVFLDLECISIRDGRAEIVIHVRDTGIGIDENQIELIFQTFRQVDETTTRKYGGTGLGLSISRQLAELMGGTIDVSSRKKEGSTFDMRVSLQVCNDFPDGKSDDASVNPAELSGIHGTRVLVADDLPLASDVIREYLDGMGVQSETTDTIEGMFRLLKNASGRNGQFDCILLDHSLVLADEHPMWKNRENVGLLRSIPIILMIPAGLPITENSFSDFPVSAFLTKPVHSEYLSEALLSVKTDAPEIRIFGHGTTDPPEKEISENGTFRNTLPRIQVLLVEDNQTNQIVAEELLKYFGCRIDLAANGKQALEKAFENNYDLILMDCEMPVMDGFEATRKIREQESASRRSSDGRSGEKKSARRIVAMTAKAMQGDREKCIDAGMDDYIAKPIRKESIASILEKFGLISPNSSVENPGEYVPENPETRSSMQSSSKKIIFDAGRIPLVIGTDKDTIRKFTELFFEDMNMQIEGIKNALNAEKTGEIERFAHRIKGAANDVGGIQMSEIAAQIELAAAKNDPVSCQNQLPALTNAFKKLKELVSDRGWT